MPTSRTDSSLTLRHGRADETLATAGWTRLVATLAARAGGRGVSVEVGMLETRLSGPPDRLDRVRAWLAAPDLSDLDDVRRDLAAHPPRVDALSTALLVRYGARGPGLAGLGETGLGWATPEALRAHAERCRADAPPVPVPVPREAPTGYAHGPERVVMSGVVPVAAAAGLGEAVVAALRDEIGGSGADAPWWRMVVVDAEHAVLLVSGWATRDRTCRMQEGRPALLAGLALPGATDFAETLLVGAHPKVLDYSWGLDAVGPAYARGEGVGRPHRHLPSGQSLLLRVDGRGVALDSGWSGPSYALADLAGVLVHPGGARTLVDRRGWTYVVDPGQWEDGAGAVTEIDALAGQDLLLTQLTDPDPAPEARLPWMPGSRLMVALMVLAVVLLLAVIIGAAVVLTLAGVSPTPYVLVGGAAAATAGLVIRARQRRPPAGS